jgi:hypothetical protein
MPVPYTCILVNIRILLIELYHAEYLIVMGNISNDKVDHIAPL